MIKGKTYSAKVFAVGPEQYISDCIKRLSFECQNLEEDEEPEVEFAPYREPLKAPLIDTTNVSKVYSDLLPPVVNNSALYETTVTPNNNNELQEVPIMLILKLLVKN